MGWTKRLLVHLGQVIIWSLVTSADLASSSGDSEGPL